MDDAQPIAPSPTPHCQTTRLWAVSVTLAAMVFLGGCGAGGPKVAGGPFAGPTSELVTRDGWYTLRVESPTPGWTITYDRSQAGADERRLFFTLRRPNPEFLYAAVIVEQLVRTDVPAGQTVAVYARILDFTQDADGVAYRRVPERQSEEPAPGGDG
jgi:hypothetical protein